jgi:NAD(P)-dependent dehydrogenase (short-subunit alcohol dehydrogenase family)
VRVEGSAAVVTGGASGLGAATVRSLVAAGASVVIADLQSDRGRALAGETGATFVRADVTSADDMGAALEHASALAPLRMLVTCAGIGAGRRTIGRDGALESAHPLDLFRRVIEVNLIGTFNAIRLAASVMSTTEPLPDGERGAVVTTASIAAFDGQIGQAAYGASKGAVVGMTLPIYGSGEGAEALKTRLSADLLFPPRFGRAEEFAAMALSCLTNTYLNGATIRLDGGARLGPA